MPKAINISAEEAYEIRYLPHNTVLISINNTFEGIFPLQVDRQSSKVLTVRFDDVTHSNEVTIKKVIDNQTVYKILDFINIHKGKDFIIHCHAGVSRSAAVALLKGF